MSSPSAKAKISSGTKIVQSPSTKKTKFSSGRKIVQSDSLTSTKATISSGVPDPKTFSEKKLQDDKLLNAYLLKAVKLHDRTPRPFDPDHHKYKSIEEYEYEFYKLKPPSPEKPPPELCKSCSTVHSSWDMCADESCSVCFSNRHLHFNCPYFRQLPKGAKFDKERFTVFCFCGCPFFDTDDWVCPANHCISTMAHLKDKKCEICGAIQDHTTYKCTEAEDLASRYKLDHELLFEIKPSSNKRSKRLRERSALSESFV